MIKIAICRKDAYGDALSVLLEKAGGFNVVGSFENMIQAVENLHVIPHIFLIDYASTLNETAYQIHFVKQKDPSVKLIMLTDNEDKDNIITCVRAGIDGYLLRNTSFLMLGDSILQARNGGFPMSPLVARQLLTGLTNSSEDNAALSLTDREREVLEQLVDGMSYKLISSNLGIAINTVRSHIKKLYEKMNVNSKSEAVSKALRQRLVEFS